MRLLVHPYNILSFFPSLLFTTPKIIQECQLHRTHGEQLISNKCLLPYMHMVFTTLYICPSSLTICSCTPYNGNECTSVFGAANLTNVGGSSVISTDDSVIEAYFTTLSAAGTATSTSISQACLNYLRLTQCLSLYTPCSGTAWCGSMSLSELTDAVNTACGCSGSTCPTLGGSQVATIRNYYQGSSSTGQVGSAMLSCQDVTLGELEVYIMTCACTAK